MNMTNRALRTISSAYRSIPKQPILVTAAITRACGAANAGIEVRVNDDGRAIGVEQTGGNGHAVRV
jgi:hypothetical protein